MRTFEIVLPDAVAGILGRLRSAGYEAYAVGGCVRDAILGRTPADWDVTSSALPEDVKRVFSDHRVIETGIRHGTVTVLCGGEPFEITTFRRDGAYLDNRHPSEVTFSARVEDDLSRRDFTVNAMAYCPERGLLDLFGGREDLSRRRIRCVGDAVTRFEEDGLRILRAVRFASVLDFALEEETAKAVHSCRHLLRNIAAERIRAEFLKLLCGKGAGRILSAYPDVLAEFLPIPEAPSAGYGRLCEAAADAPADPTVRLSLFLCGIGADCGTVMKKLRFDNAAIERVGRLTSRSESGAPESERDLRRLLRELPAGDAEALGEVIAGRYALAGKPLPPYAERFAERAGELYASGVCLSMKDLAVSGNDLIAAGMAPGRGIGEVLTKLLDRVVDGDLPNERETLLREAATLS